MEEETSVIEGHTASLLCDVQAYPPPEMTWTRDGQVLAFGTGVHILPGRASATCYNNLIRRRWFYVKLLTQILHFMFFHIY